MISFKGVNFFIKIKNYVKTLIIRNWLNKITTAKINELKHVKVFAGNQSK